MLNNVSGFCCPICKEQLNKESNSLRCVNNHSFDLSKSGYVNLLLSQKSKDKRHGDDKAMINARKNFLDLGKYSTLLDRIVAFLKENLKKDSLILDVGCGECYYTDKIYKSIKDSFNGVQFAGLDISKDALIYASKRNKDIELCVASIFSIPVRDKSVDIILNMFAPYVDEEFNRIIKDGGYLIRTFPRENHLWELKEAIYNTPYKNEIDTLELEHFELIKEERITYEFDLNSNNDIMNLFMMTPYYYKTSVEGQNRAKNISSLNITADFDLVIYKKKGV